MSFVTELKSARRLASTIESNQTISNSTAETEIIATPELKAGDVSNTKTRFRAFVGGLHTSTVTNDTIVWTLRYGTTDILELTVTQATSNSNGVLTQVAFDGRIHTAGASGKVVALGEARHNSTTKVEVLGATANAGVTIDWTDLDDLNVTAKLGTANATTALTCQVGYIEVLPDITTAGGVTSS